ncbi:CGNR zinc finger domain-containing protein [Brachybacterium sp. GCM10030267]|uniref:CGNR zinc finger domain-containing protein n=1 Tax=unclassified Brachybacterium TaxID=2623841 RepID=UPI003616362D
MSTAHPEFRLGTVLATSFTATLSERHGEPVERIPTPKRLLDWFAVSGLPVDSCDGADLEQALELRESIHVAGTAVAQGETLPADRLEVINDCSAGGHAAAVLTADGTRRWQLGSLSPARDALGVVAADAIEILSGERDGRLAICASPTCRAIFFDTSRSRTRRWCDMNTCGNRQKKARFRNRH